MLQGTGEIRCEGDTTCQLSDKCAGARQMCGAKTPFPRAQVLCVPTVACVQVKIVLLLIPVGIGSMMRIMVVDVDVE